MTHSQAKTRLPGVSLPVPWGHRRWRGAWQLALALLVLPTISEAATDGPSVGSWATYRWTSSVKQDVPVLIQETAADGKVTWSLERESVSPPPLYVTYAIVRGDARTYTLQIVTQQTLEGTPLSVTQVTVDRRSGRAVRSVIQRPKGVIATPESGLRPFAPGAVTGTSESVQVPAGTFTSTRAPYQQNATVWVSDQVPALGLVKATFPDGVLELVRSGAAGAKDLLRS